MEGKSLHGEPEERIYLLGPVRGGDTLAEGRWVDSVQKGGKISFVGTLKEKNPIKTKQA